jgi:hypothetical protein
VNAIAEFQKEACVWPCSWLISFHLQKDKEGKEKQEIDRVEAENMVASGPKGAVTGNQCLFWQPYG